MIIMINDGEHLQELKNDEIYRIIYNLPGAEVQQSFFSLYSVNL